MARYGTLTTLTLGQRLQAERRRLKTTPKELAGAAGIPIDSYRKYEGDSAVPGGSALAGLARAGVKVEWLLTGIEPVRTEQPVAARALAEERRAGNHAINLDRLTLVVGAVELLLPGWSPKDRANVVALAYDYMAAKNSADPVVLAAFLRQWAKSALSQPPVPDFHSPDVTGTAPTPHGRVTDK